MRQPVPPSEISPAARFWAEFQESKVAVVALAVVVLMLGVLFGGVTMAIGMLVHEISVLVVIVIAMRLLRRREEVEILRLVGAGVWYIRTPLLAGAGFLGAVGSVAGLGLVELTRRALATVAYVPPLWLRLPPLPLSIAALYAVMAVLVAVGAGYLASRSA